MLPHTPGRPWCHDGGVTRVWDVLALVGTGIVLVTTIVYLGIVDAQDSTPAWWAVVVLVATCSAGLYAARKDSPGRRPVLLVGGLLLGGLGLVSLLSIGPLLLVASVCLLVAAARHRPLPPTVPPTPPVTP